MDKYIANVAEIEKGRRDRTEVLHRLEQASLGRIRSRDLGVQEPLGQQATPPCRKASLLSIADK